MMGGWALPLMLCASQIVQKKRVVDDGGLLARQAIFNRPIVFVEKPTFKFSVGETSDSILSILLLGTPKPITCQLRSDQQIGWVLSGIMALQVVN